MSKIALTAGHQMQSQNAAASSDIKSEAQFMQAKSDMAFVQEVLPFHAGKIIIHAIKNLKNTCELILQNNRLFDFSISLINAVYGSDKCLKFESTCVGSCEGSGGTRSNMNVS
jgi:hypothetical protein